MRLFSALILTLAFPVQALAAFGSAHEVLGATRHTGAPREFTAQAHNNNGDMYLSTWVRGVQEGKDNWLKMRMDVTTHMKQRQDFITINMRILVYQDTLYYTITDTQLRTEDELTKTQLQSMLKKWVAMPLPAGVDSMSAWNFVDILETIDMDMLNLSDAWNDVRTSIGNFSMENTKYQGGYAYSVYPMSSDINLHIKVNAGNDGTLHYGKYYVSRGNFVFQGDMQPHGSSVYLDVPTNTIGSEEFAMHMLGFEFPMMYGDVPLPVSPVPNSTNTPKPHVRKPMTLEYKGEPEIPEARNYVEYAKDSGNSQEESITCAWPGTLDAVELERKGVCPKTKLTRREIRQRDRLSLSGSDLRELRLEESRMIDNFNSIAEKFENHVHRRDMHLAKAMLARNSITSVGSENVDDWLSTEVIPFYIPMMRSTVVEYMLIEDRAGNEGVAIEKMIVTESGRRKSAVIVIFESSTSNKPVVSDEIGRAHV